MLKGGGKIFFSHETDDFCVCVFFFQMLKVFFWQETIVTHHVDGWFFMKIFMFFELYKQLSMML